MFPTQRGRTVSGVQISFPANCAEFKKDPTVTVAAVRDPAQPIPPAGETVCACILPKNSPGVDCCGVIVVIVELPQEETIPLSPTHRRRQQSELEPTRAREKTNNNNNNNNNNTALASSSPPHRAALGPNQSTVELLAAAPLACRRVRCHFKKFVTALLNRLVHRRHSHRAVQLLPSLERAAAAAAVSPVGPPSPQRIVDPASTMSQSQPSRLQAPRVVVKQTPRAPTATAATRSTTAAASAPRSATRAAPASAPAKRIMPPPTSARVPDNKRSAPAPPSTATRVPDAARMPPPSKVPLAKHAAPARRAATPRPTSVPPPSSRRAAAPAARSATAARQPRQAATTPASTASASLPSASAAVLGVAAPAPAVSPRRLELPPGLRGPASSSRCRRRSLNGTVYDLADVTWSQIDDTVIEADTTTTEAPDVVDVHGRTADDVDVFVRTGRWPGVRARPANPDDSFDVEALRHRIDALDEEADRYRACIELSRHGTIAGRRVRREPSWVREVARQCADSA